MDACIRVVTRALEKKGLTSDLFLEVESRGLDVTCKREGAVMGDSQGSGSTEFR